jgi:Tol biopolymer transport system component
LEKVPSHASLASGADTVAPMSRRRRFVPLAAVVLSLAGGGVAQAASNGKIAYAEETFDAPDAPQLRTIDPFGPASFSAFGEEGACCGAGPAPSWTRDGKQIAFSRPTFDDQGNFGLSDLWSVDRNLGGVVNLTNTPDVAETEPSWSPDGNRVAFVADGGIWVLNLATGNRARLSPAGSSDDEPAWSPTADKIAFTRDGDIFVMGATPGASAKRLTSRSAFEASPTWSPGGTRIAWAVFGDKPGIYKMRSDGSDQTRLTRAQDFHPTWSPDGSKIAFSRPIPDETLLFPDYLWVMHCDGSGAKHVLAAGKPVLGVTPDWGAAPARRR